MRRVDANRLNGDIVAAVLPPATHLGGALCVSDRGQVLTPLHRGRLMMVTHNVAKGQGLVNGAMGRVVAKRHSSVLLQSVECTCVLVPNRAT